ncbi:hypothetical protein MKZ38_003442 [Zalerion maritima]|uniref:Uncharacterized protein n=1 Tax=Zalerion maritima TaxID=339359 RepID=A0AAD5RMN9_9PEZI|nr:hypothetical protein MKZ38_003442 [Zalerion maritima]
MLDENLPTFVSKPPSPDNPYLQVLYLQQNGDEPRAEYIIKRPDPSLSASRNRYAVGLVDSFAQDVVYAEVLIEPEWTQPSLSAAEIRAQNGVPPPPVPILPDSFTIQLYNPDQQVLVKQIPSSWNSKESYEFEMPEQSFRRPSVSKVDREQDDPVASEITPKIMFRWKREGRLSKDMTCFMTGKSLAGKKSKDPDITVAMFRQRRGGETSVTVYEPNMQRVEVEDRKGLDIVLLLGAEVIRDLYLSPGSDPFNVASGPGATGTVPVAKRKNSRPSAGNAPVGGPSSSGAAGGASGMPTSEAIGKPPSSKPTTSNGKPELPVTTIYNIPGKSSSPAANASSSAAAKPPPHDPRTQWEIDAETKRLRALVEKEEREREKWDKAEQKRIKKMLEDEGKERRRRDAEVTKETERLKKLYGIEGQDFGGASGGRPPPPPVMASSPPQLPPRRPQVASPGGYSGPVMSGAGGGHTLSPTGPSPWVGGTVPPPPPRPVSAGPPAMFQNCSILNAISSHAHGHRRSSHGQSQSGGGFPYMQVPGTGGASLSSLGLPFGGGNNGGRDRKKMQKKRSVHF